VRSKKNFSDEKTPEYGDASSPGKKRIKSLSFGFNDS